MGEVVHDQARRRASHGRSRRLYPRRGLSSPLATCGDRPFFRSDPAAHADAHQSRARPARAGLKRPGQALDSRHKGPLVVEESFPVIGSPPDPLKRRSDRRADFRRRPLHRWRLTCGKGQRMGIFAAAGGGKSTLLGMIARNARADVNVISLIGERGREVREFLENDLGPEGMARSVIIVSTSDQAAQLRINAAYVGTAIAEYFREQGKTVILMMDSVTRFAKGLARNRALPPESLLPGPASPRPSSPPCPAFSSAPATPKKGSMTAVLYHPRRRRRHERARLRRNAFDPRRPHHPLL